VCAPLLSPIRATLPVFLILLHLIMTMYLVLSASTSSTFFLPPVLHPTQRSLCISKCFRPVLGIPENCRT
jgi:hypothetical protein